MKRKIFGCVIVALVFSTGCTVVSAGAGSRSETSLCEQSRKWGQADSGRAKQVSPDVSEDDNGRSYRFNLGGRDGLQQLEASCGWGTYAECTFKATQSDGVEYQFSEMSTFGLWETQQGLYLVYHIAAPKDEVEKAKRRLVKLGNPPSEVCNQIGDYSKLM